MSVNEMIGNITKESDIAYGSDLYLEVYRSLIDFGLNLAFFTFTTVEHSSCARKLYCDIVSCPVLKLYLRFNVDFQQTGIDLHQGNWDDKWSQTRAVRDRLNAILQKHRLDNEYLSDHTFIFVYTLEELAFQQLGRRCADGIKQLVTTYAPEVRVDGVYWDGTEYYVLLRDKDDYKRVKHNVKEAITKEIPKLFANADTEGYCQEYKTIITFGYGGIVPMQFLLG